MANQAKMIRGQLRVIVKETLSQILTTEMVSAIRKQLSEELAASMKPLDADVRLSMQNLNKRYEELASYIIRQLEASQSLPSISDKPPTETL